MIGLLSFRIACDVSGQYRRQSAFDPIWPLLHHGARKLFARQLYYSPGGCGANGQAAAWHCKWQGLAFSLNQAAYGE
jgi:hypothetical protein